MRYPAALAALPFLIGAAAGILLADAVNLPLAAAAAAVLSLAAACAYFADGFAEGAVAALTIGYLMAGLSMGASAAHAAYHPSLLAWFDARPPSERDDAAALEGVLREDATLSAFGTSLSIDVRRVVTPARDGSRSVRGGVRLSVGGASGAGKVEEWRAGRTVRVAALLRRPTAYRDPGLPDEERALARRGIVLVGSIKSAALVDIVARGSSAAEAAAAIRAWSRRRLERYVGCWSAQSGAIATAILIGDRSGLSEDDERRLQEAGTYHVIAISGGNIAILTVMLLFALHAVRMPPGAAAAVAIAALIFYGLLTGAGASVSRAVTAAVVFLGGRVLDHRGPPLNALAVAAISGVAVSPLAAFDAGFILSFGATLGILIGVPRLKLTRGAGWRGGPLTAFARRVAAAGMGLFAATLCAEIALAPIGAELFSRITVAGLILNFAAIPLMTIAQGSAIATLAAAPVSERLARGCGYVTYLATAGIVESARLVDVAPWLSQTVAPPSWWMVAAFYASALALLRPRTARAGAAGIVLCALIMIAGPTPAARGAVPPPPAGTLRVAFIDVGQGDATLVIPPRGRPFLVDAGGVPGSTFDIGERVLAPVVRALGVRRLAALAVTHGDPDHVGGAAAVVRNFDPGEIWEGVPVPPLPALRALAALAASRGASWRTLQAGDAERTGGIEIRVLHPPPPEWERQRVRNDDSIVLELRIGEVSVILPGDIGAEGERAVAARLALAPTVILKAPHHGSATSSTPDFVAATHPAAVVFSSGRANRFGHPAPPVVARYRAAGALIFRTDEDGAIILDTDGHTVRLTTWSGRRLTLQ